MNHKLLKFVTCLVFVLVGLLLTSHHATTVYAQSGNAITSPADGAVVSGVVEVRGRAVDPNFRRIEVYLLLDGDPSQATFIDLRGNPADGRITAFDSSKYPDGDHILRVRVVRQDRNFEELLTRITIRNVGVTPVDNNGITNVRPVDGITVRGPIRIGGVATMPNFHKWELALLVGENPDKIVQIAESQQPILTTNSFVDALDTTQYPDGRHTLRLRVTARDGSYKDYPIAIIIDNATPRTDAANGIFEPTEGATVRCLVRVQGIADHPTFRKWQLDILPGGDANRASFVAFSSVPTPQQGQLVQLDTLRFANGDYQLRLRVVHSNMNYAEYFRNFTIDNSDPNCAEQTVEQAAPEERPARRRARN